MSVYELALVTDGFGYIRLQTGVYTRFTPGTGSLYALTGGLADKRRPFFFFDPSTITGNGETVSSAVLLWEATSEPTPVAGYIQVGSLDLELGDADVNIYSTSAGLTSSSGALVAEAASGVIGIRETPLNENGIAWVQSFVDGLPYSEMGLGMNFELLSGYRLELGSDPILRVATGTEPGVRRPYQNRPNYSRTIRGTWPWREDRLW